MNTEISDNHINEIKNEINELLDAVKKMPIDKQKDKNDDVKEMIKYYDGMTNKIEDRRIKSSDKSWQNLAISLTALGLLLGFPFINLIRIPLFIVFGVLILMSIVKIIDHHYQSGFRYPFLKYPEFSNKWKWFYYGNEYIKRLNSNPLPIFRNRLSIEDSSNYLSGLKLFISNYKNETLDQELTDNIIQLYLLQVHNYYKNRFYLRLNKYNLITLILILIFVVAFFIVAFVLIKYDSCAADYLLKIPKNIQSIQY